MSGARTDRLNTWEMRRMLDFLLYHVAAETRYKLMADMPVAYTKLYPTYLDIETIVKGQVDVAISDAKPD
jgi:hypothetical protein